MPFPEAHGTTTAMEQLLCIKKTGKDSEAFHRVLLTKPRGEERTGTSLTAQSRVAWK